jgi:hypothetical protein
MPSGRSKRNRGAGRRPTVGANAPSTFTDVANLAAVISIIHDLIKLTRGGKQKIIDLGLAVTKVADARQHLPIPCKGVCLCVQL